MEHIEARWDTCKTLLGQKIGPEDCAAWLQSMQLDELRPGRIVFSGVPNTYFKHRILSQFRGLILSTLHETFPEIELSNDSLFDLKVGASRVLSKATGASTESVGAEFSPDIVSTAPESTASLGEDAAASAAAPFNNTLGSAFRFEDFISSETTDIALQSAIAVARQPGKKFNPLVLVGSSGVGKTHLLQSIAHHIRQENPQINLVTCNGDEFKNDVLEGITKRRMPQLRDHYRKADVLLLDDFDYLVISPRAQEELLHTFNHLLEAGKQLVFVLNKLPRAIPNLIDPLRSRFEMGLIAELGIADLNTRHRFLLLLAKKHQLPLPDSLARMLAERITRNLRQLEGAMVRLAAFTALDHKRLTPEGVEKIAEPFFDNPETALKTIPTERILDRVSTHFGMSVRSLKGRNRSPNFTLARRVAIHLLKVTGRLSYVEIGSILGNRTHSTIIHGHQTLKEEMTGNPLLKSRVTQFERNLSDWEG